MVMKRHCAGWCIVIGLAASSVLQAQESRFGLGFRAGVGRIDGDVKEEVLTPFVSGILFYSPDPHLSLGLEAGAGDYWSDDDAQRDSVARAGHLEFDLTFRFSPYRRISPFATLGAGGFFWYNFLDATGETIHPGMNRDDVTYVVKTAGGLEISLSRRVSWSLGAAFRYSFTDLLDLDPSGDENDALVTVFSGLTLKLGSGPPDRDHDGVLDRYDLDSRVKEDRDGYMDHDGVPDTQISSNLLAFTGTPESSATDDIPPIVIHEPVLRASAGSDLRLRAEIFENRSLLRAAVLYRPVNVRRWLVVYQR